MTPQEALTQLDKALQETARLKRRLTRLHKTYLPTLYWDLSSRVITLITALSFSLEEDKKRLQEMCSPKE